MNTLSEKKPTPLRRRSIGRMALLSVALTFVAPSLLSVSALGPVDDNAVRSAWALYSKQQYAASSDAFEKLIRTSTPNARLYYYAAAANKCANRVARAKQLCQYITANFPSSTEAGYAKQLFPDAAPAASAALPEGLPDSMKGKSLDELMQTEEGRRALKEALKKNPSPSPASVTSVSKANSTNDAGKGGPLSAQEIAADGANGVTSFAQGCFLECEMDAVAMLPRGPALIARMIQSSGANYLIRLPGSGEPYTVTPQMLEKSTVKDKDLWATLVHLAIYDKFHARGSANLEEPLGMLTGNRAEKIYASNTTEGTLVSFIADAVKAQNPVVCFSGDDFGTLEELVEPEQGFVITGFDPASKMVTMMNPHGDNSRRFRLKTDPEHQKFEQLNGGMFKMHISLFPRYFSEVCRSSF